MDASVELRNYAYHLVQCMGVIDDGYQLDFDDLDDHDQSNLLAMYLKAKDQDIEGFSWNCDDFKNVIAEMFRFLSNPDNDHAIQFGKTSIKSLMNYYHNSLQQVLNDACGELNSDRDDPVRFYQHEERI